MSFDFGKTLADMLDAAKKVSADEWPAIQDDVQRVFRDQEEALKDIAKARIRGDIDDDDLKRQLEDEKEALAAGLAMVRSTRKSTIQRVLNAAVEVFWTAVRAAL